jgi:hypothetical protein
MKARWPAVLAIALLVVGCNGTKPPPAPQPVVPEVPEVQPEPAEEVTVLEVEEFTLKDAKVQALAAAGGGKVVVLQGDLSTAEKTIQLAKGTYTVTVYAFAPSYEEDAFYLTVGDGYEERIFPEEINKVLPAGPVTHTQKADGPCKISLGFGEENVQLDRVEIKPVP